MGMGEKLTQGARVQGTSCMDAKLLGATLTFWLQPLLKQQQFEVFDPGDVPHVAHSCSLQQVPVEGATGSSVWGGEGGEVLTCSAKSGAGGSIQVELMTNASCLQQGMHPVV